MTINIEELKFRKSICGSCEFNIGDKCTKLDLEIRLAAFQPVCPENKWESSKDYPKLLEQMKTFTSSMAKWVKSGLSRVSEDVFQSRLAVCKGCEFWDGKALKGTGRCRKCGCSTWGKLKLATEKCPIDKWGPA